MIEKLKMQDLWLYILIGLVLGYIIYTLSKGYRKEGITNVASVSSLTSNENKEIAKKVYQYFVDHKTVDFVDYINFLTSIKNTNLDIIDLEVFYELKSLKKKGKLTLENILNEMTNKGTEKVTKSANASTTEKETNGQTLKDNTKLLKSILEPFLI